MLDIPDYPDNEKTFLMFENLYNFTMEKDYLKIWNSFQMTYIERTQSKNDNFQVILNPMFSSEPSRKKVRAIFVKQIWGVMEGWGIYWRSQKLQNRQIFKVKKFRNSQNIQTYPNK